MSTECDVLIAGGGIVGLASALYLAETGRRVVVIERQQAMRGASWAAAGMLAADDPENPPELTELARYSAVIYRDFLARVQLLSGLPVPFRTRLTLQQVTHGNAAETSDLKKIRDENAPGLRIEKGVWQAVREYSVEPRDICRALPVAVKAAGVLLLENTALLGVREQRSGVLATTSGGEFEATQFVNAAGCWAAQLNPDLPVAPRKGQMVTVSVRAEALRCVVRTPDIYLVPRGDGRLLIGATVEDAGFNTEVEPRALAALLRKADEILPGIGQATQLDAWAGLRPGTPDDLPLIGSIGRHSWIAAGHFRNGVLLAPATAVVLMCLLRQESSPVSVKRFSPARFGLASAHGDNRSFAAL